MYETIKAFFMDQLKVPAEYLTPDAELADLGIDSLTLVELALILEAECGAPITDEDLKPAKTMSELAQLAEERLPLTSLDE